MNRKKLTIEEFRKVREAYFCCDNVDLYLDNFDDEKNIEDIIFEKKYELLNYLASFDLSNIPFKEWKDIELVCSEDHCVDFSKTKANLDFDLVSVNNQFNSDYFNFHGCNIKNLFSLITKASRYSSKSFDNKTIQENLHVFLNPLVDINLQEIFYSGGMNIDYLLNHPEYHQDLKNIDLQLLGLLLSIIKVDGESTDLINFIKRKFNQEDSFNLIIDYGKYLSKKEVQCELQKINWRQDCSKEDVLKNIEQSIKQSILNGMEYDEALPSSFKEHNQRLFLPSTINPEIKKNFYERKYTIEDVINKGLLDSFEDIDITIVLGKKYNKLYGLFNNQTCLELMNKFGDLILSNESLINYLQNVVKEPLTINEAKEKMLEYFYIKNEDLRTAAILLALGVKEEPVIKANEIYQKLLKDRPGINLNDPILGNKYFTKYGYDTISIVSEYNSGADEVLIKAQKENDDYLDKWINYIKKSPLYNKKMLHYALLMYENSKPLIHQLVDNDIALDNEIVTINLKKILWQGNEYGVSNVHELVEYSKYRSQLLNQKISDSCNIVEVRNLIMQALYNVSLNDANRIINNFELKRGNLIDLLIRDTAIDEEDKKMIADIIEFTSLEDVDQIKNKYYELLSERLKVDNNLIRDGIDLEQKLKLFYAKEIKESLYKEQHTGIRESWVKGINDPNVLDINGKLLTDETNIKVIHFDGVNFKILVHLIHSFDEKYKDFPPQILENPAKWNELEGTSTVSTSMISNQCIKCLDNHGEKGVYYGFTDFPIESFITMSICDASSKHNPKLLAPNAMENVYEIPEILQLNTMIRWIHYNEILLDRKEEHLSNFQNRIQPNCIISFDEQINDESKRAAQYFNIPIYVIDKKKYEELNRQKIESFKNKEITLFDENDVELVLFMTSNNINNNYNLLVELSNKALDSKKINQEKYTDIIKKATRLKEYASIYEQGNKVVTNTPSVQPIGLK